MRAPARLAAFAGALALVVAAGAGLGAAAGPLDVDGGEDEAHDGVSHDSTAGTGDEVGASGTSGTVEPPGGLAVAQGGYRLDVPTTTYPGGARVAFAFRVVDEEGRAVTDYEVEHEKRLHLVVVGRDLTGYAHVHPALGSDGTWQVELPALAPGSYRAFADFRPAGGDALTLGVDLELTGDRPAVEVPAPSREAEVDGYAVDLDGDVRAGSSELSFTVHRGGETVRTDPYLGAAGHLVAIRDGDLAYLHVHPIEGDGAEVRFAAELPTPGRYRVFLDFAHGGAVHTAAFTVEVPAAGAAPADHDDGGH